MCGKLDDKFVFVKELALVLNIYLARHLADLIGYYQ